MKRNIIKIFFIALLLSVVGGFFILSEKNAEAPVVEKTEISQNSEADSDSKKEEIKAPEEKPAVKPKALPDKILTGVPFTSQAPFAEWDELHEEACEEASLIMLKYYLDGKKLTPEIAESEIQRMVDFEIKNYGDYRDSDAGEIVKLAEDFYGIRNLKAVYDFPKEDLKKYLARGEPIIVPAAGRLLGNPNFTAPGPLYHNLVLIGYNGNTIITNDPGTRKGQGYTYNMDVLYNAIHDFPGKPEDITQGRKAMIVLEK